MINSHWNQWHPIYWLSKSSDSCWQRVEKSVNDICMEKVKQVKQVYTYLQSIVNARKFQSSNDKMIMHHCKNILFFGCLYLWLSRPGLLRSWYCSTLRYFHDQTVVACCYGAGNWKGHGLFFTLTMVNFCAEFFVEEDDDFAAGWFDSQSQGRLVKH
jgi:hypothetical protein